MQSGGANNILLTFMLYQLDVNNIQLCRCKPNCNTSNDWYSTEQKRCTYKSWQPHANVEHSISKCSGCIEPLRYNDTPRYISRHSKSITIRCKPRAGTLGSGQMHFSIP